MSTKIYRERCKTCKFRAAVQDVNGCDFILITGKSRGCDPENCTRYEEGNKIKLPEAMAHPYIPKKEDIFDE